MSTGDSQNEKQEEWRPIPHWEDLYIVSSKGRVRSLHPKKSKTDGLVGSVIHGRRYAYLCRNGNESKYPISRLVLLTFCGPAPSGYHAAHLNGDAMDDRLENLAWVTPKENEAHKEQHGTKLWGEQLPLAKLNPDKVRQIRILRGEGKTYKEIASLFKVHWDTVREVVLGTTWSWVA